MVFLLVAEQTRCVLFSVAQETEFNRLQFHHGPVRKFAAKITSAAGRFFGTRFADQGQRGYIAANSAPLR